MTQDPNPNHAPGTWTVAQNGQPVKSSIAFGSKELADNLAKKMNAMFGVNAFGSIQKPQNQNDK